MTRKKQPTVSALVKKLDREFSRFIRMKYADEGGTVECVCCGKLMHWKEAHASHYISRRHMSLRFDEMNVFPACVRCNTFEYGNIPEYTRFLQDKFGGDIVDRLLFMKHQTRKWTRQELEDLIAHYKQAAAREESRVGVV